ncbi:hypothetical protein M378DRAFT_165652 [Amanita muscaria Koide BX008]|uniref:Uncharacterized protein n=1 Tax=Amanita muscaria (strain Koide BX008) TaxID=946122 RepID=A0A0C2WZZ4_AMAMK|nr:hypothetical protein M378DRAFT_165652 [Amanita muscaria Koide BX008]
MGMIVLHAMKVTWDQRFSQSNIANAVTFIRTYLAKYPVFRSLQVMHSLHRG